MKGRNFVDKADKIRRGTLVKSRANPTLLKGRKVKTLRTPDWLGKIAAARWRWAVRILAGRRTLVEDDVPMLELLCLLYQKMRLAEADGKELNSALVAQLRNLGESFGFTPASRAKVHVPADPDPDDPAPDSWAAFRKEKS